MNFDDVLIDLAQRPYATIRTRSGAQYGGKLGFTGEAGLLKIDVPGGAHGNKLYTIFVWQSAIEAMW